MPENLNLIKAGAHSAAAECTKLVVRFEEATATLNKELERISHVAAHMQLILTQAHQEAINCLQMARASYDSESPFAIEVAYRDSVRSLEKTSQAYDQLLLLANSTFPRQTQ